MLRETFKHRNIAIIGYGIEGQAIHEFLKGSPDFTRAAIDILDKKQDPNYLQNLEKYDLIIKSPGVPEHPEIEQARTKGIPFTSATQLFFERKKGLVIGITGTKGKGSTSTLLYTILKEATKDVYLAGNIGTPALEILPQLTENSITILELSSFQLQFLPYSPEIAVVLEIFPDHLDAHKNFEEYLDAKSYIAKNQKDNDAIFYFPHNENSTAAAMQSKGKKLPVDPTTWTMFAQQNLQIPGAHNFQNAVMAASVAEYLKVDSTKIITAVENFEGLPLRLQFIKVRGKLKFYNDSASTNPQSTIAAIQAFQDPIILIAGGKDKGFPYEPMGDALKNSSVKQVILLGENKQIIHDAIRSSGISSMFANELEDAVAQSMKIAEKENFETAGGVIVFSPGSASFDMFSDYKDRGNQFTDLVKNL